MPKVIQIFKQGRKDPRRVYALSKIRVRQALNLLAFFIAGSDDSMTLKNP